MTKYFNANPVSFYDSEINVIPTNSIEITDELWVSLLNGQSSGKIIVADSNGNPILQDPVKTIIVAPTPLEKLTSLGLTVDDLKSLIAS